MGDSSMAEQSSVRKLNKTNFMRSKQKILSPAPQAIFLLNYFFLPAGWSKKSGIFFNIYQTAIEKNLTLFFRTIHLAKKKLFSANLPHASWVPGIEIFRLLLMNCQTPVKFGEFQSSLGKACSIIAGQYGIDIQAILCGIKSILLDPFITASIWFWKIQHCFKTLIIILTWYCKLLPVCKSFIIWFWSPKCSNTLI